MSFQKIVYWVATGLLTAIMLFSVYNYLFHNEAVAGYFEHFGYPTYIIYPLATAKILGLVAIWGNFSKWLSEWAYAGFFFNTLLAFFAHYISDGTGYLFAILVLLSVLGSYFTYKQVRY
ncbi:DoxX family protein [Spongiimicrobium sp. 3-5]|uniref:DoxX family protein n=1 Tax=Spongiimicrobium sp. 3-5 TaxID=3332596 RepID=UPI00398036E5